MLSLKERISLLEADLKASPMRISVYRDLPFAILRYEPEEEWQLRREVNLLATRMEQGGKEVRVISLAELLWKAIEASEGIDAVAAVERQRGFDAAQRQVATYLTNPLWEPLPELVAAEMAALDPRRHIAFLVRAAALAPAIYHLSALLGAMQGRTEVPAILFYPGTQEGTNGLRSMGLADREALSNYRVKIYG